MDRVTEAATKIFGWTRNANGTWGTQQARNIVGIDWDPFSNPLNDYSLLRHVRVRFSFETLEVMDDWLKALWSTRMDGDIGRHFAYQVGDYAAAALEALSITNDDGELGIGLGGIDGSGFAI